MRRSVLHGCVVVLLLLAFAPQLPAQNLDALMEAVDKIEANLAEMVQQEAATRDQQIAELKSTIAGLDASLDNLLAGKTSAAQPNPSVKHGKIALSAFVHEHFVSGSDETSSFVSKRARISVKGDINEYAQIKVQGEFAKSPKLLDGQVTISPHKQWSFSMGQYKPPFGTDFLISSTSTPFVNRSKAVKLCTDRDVGFSMSYRNSFSPDFSLK
ncbi:MAG: hypothetical protein J7J98_01180, partial [candidate division Zixibacteria bacterium]|nr:hypothetical protein [candidate division Zixibacteria bacterium]